MAGNERFDDSIGRWLEETAPDRLPQRVLATTFERTRRTRQDPAWRAVLGRLQMPRFVPALGGIAVVVVATVLAVSVINVPGLGGQATPPPSAVASPSFAPRPTTAPGFSRFTSPLNGISMDYPSGWQVRPATQPWGHDPVGFAASDLDVIYDPDAKADLFIGVASAPVGAQSEPPDLTFGLGTPSKVCDGANWGEQGDLGGGAGRVTVDGFRGWAGYCTDQRVLSNDYVFVQTATRGYIIFLHVGDESRTPGYTEDWFDALFKTIDLLP